MGSQQKILVVFGTRPEAIKLAPVILAFQGDARFAVVTCSTGQHRDLILPALELFGLRVDHDLNVMQPGQSIDHVTIGILQKLPEVFSAEQPDLVIVQGDTSTTFAAALSAFYHKIPIAHVEAGLRTHDLGSPWPEEGNRALVSRLADYHFAPTPAAYENLLRENVGGQILMTGNTVVDAALIASRNLQGIRELEIALRLSMSSTEQKRILFTMHRRESFGEPVERVLKTLRTIARQHDVEIVFPVHPNPHIAGPARRILSGMPNKPSCKFGGISLPPENDCGHLNGLNATL